MSRATDDDAVSVFRSIVSGEPNVAIAVAAIRALSHVVRSSKASTMMELEIALKATADKLKATEPSSISLAAGCELFNRYVTRTSLDVPNFEDCVKRLGERGETFAQMSLNSRKHIADLVDRFISTDKTILVHGFSRVVISSLVQSASSSGKQFRVLVTEGRPIGDGQRAVEQLLAAGIPVTFIVDAAVGYAMEQVDFVLSGAEGVVESGGIINKIGTYQVAMIARALNKKFYVAAECYKFARLFPLSQADLPEAKSAQKPLMSSPNFKLPQNSQFNIDNPSCDYTPPECITLLFTDLGILTPSAVSDELIKLYA